MNIDKIKSLPDWIRNYGINIAVGYEGNIEDNTWRLPAEIGTFIVTHSEQSRLKLGTRFVIFEEDTLMVDDNVWVTESLRKGIFFRPLFGFGMIWYSYGK